MHVRERASLWTRMLAATTLVVALFPALTARADEPAYGVWTGTITVHVHGTFDYRGVAGLVEDYGEINGETTLAVTAQGNSDGVLDFDDGPTPNATLQSQSYYEHRSNANGYNRDDGSPCVTSSVLRLGPASGGIRADGRPGGYLEFGATADDTGTTRVDQEDDPVCRGITYPQRDWLYGPLTWCGHIPNGGYHFGYPLPTPIVRTVVDTSSGTPRNVLVMQSTFSDPCVEVGETGAADVTMDLRFSSGPPACSNGLDDDGDGRIDYPTDPGCTGPDGTAESPDPACGDGFDNDGDGLVDYPADTFCLSIRDTAESACPDVGTVVPVTLNEVDVPVKTLFKPWSIDYGDLPLTFTSEPPVSGSTCTFQSSVGSLPVLLDPVGIAPYLIATSTTSAAVSFLSARPAAATCNFKLLEELGGAVGNHCYLDRQPRPGEQVFHWTSPGFALQYVLGGPVIQRGALDFYVTADDLFPDGVRNDARAVEVIEEHVHETLIAELPLVDKATLIQDPPGELIVRDAKGRLVGRDARGGTHQGIPGASYHRSKTNNVVFIPDPAPGTLQISVSGPSRSAYQLAVSSVIFGGTNSRPLVVSSLHHKGKLDAHGKAKVTSFVDLEAPHLTLKTAGKVSRAALHKVGTSVTFHCKARCVINAVLLSRGRVVARTHLSARLSGTVHVRPKAFVAKGTVLTLAVRATGGNQRRTLISRTIRVT